MSPPSGSLKIAQQFIAGNQIERESKSAERTTELQNGDRSVATEIQGALTNVPSSFSRPLDGLTLINTPDPTDKSVGYYHSSAARTHGVPRSRRQPQRPKPLERSRNQDRSVDHVAQVVNLRSNLPSPDGRGARGEGAQHTRTLSRYFRLYDLSKMSPRIGRSKIAQRFIAGNQVARELESV
jgi:hypothetical protein